jgi:hypothetical protein
VGFCWITESDCHGLVERKLTVFFWAIMIVDTRDSMFDILLAISPNWSEATAGSIKLPTIAWCTLVVALVSTSHVSSLVLDASFSQAMVS